MTYTIWSNNRKWEFIVRDGERTIHRSGLVYNNRSACKRALELVLKAYQIGAL